MDFYKDAFGWKVGNMYAPAGSFVLTVEDNKIYVDGLKQLIPGADVTNISKNDIGDKYADINEFITATADFFVKALAYGGYKAGSVGRYVVFYEEFTGTGIASQFTLTGNIQNATFITGGWSLADLLNNNISHVVGTNLKRIYDSTNFLTRNRIEIVSISTVGLVTLNHPPRLDQIFRVYYTYELGEFDELDNYIRDDIVTKQEDDIKLSPAETKQSYESNDNTNEFNDVEKAKLAKVPTAEAFMYITGNATVTPLTQNVWSKIVGTYQTYFLDRFAHTTGRLTYTHTDAFQGVINLALGGWINDKIAEIRIFKNGSIYNVTALNTLMGKIATKSAYSFLIPIDLVQNDFIEVNIRNITGDDDATIENLQLHIKGRII